MVSGLPPRGVDRCPAAGVRRLLAGDASGEHAPRRLWTARGSPCGFPKLGYPPGGFVGLFRLGFLAFAAKKHTKAALVAHRVGGAPASHLRPPERRRDRYGAVRRSLHRRHGRMSPSHPPIRNTGTAARAPSARPRASSARPPRPALPLASRQDDQPAPLCSLLRSVTIPALVERGNLAATRTVGRRSAAPRWMKVSKTRRTLHRVWSGCGRCAPSSDDPLVVPARLSANSAPATLVVPSSAMAAEGLPACLLLNFTLSRSQGETSLPTPGPLAGVWASNDRPEGSVLAHIAGVVA